MSYTFINHHFHSQLSKIIKMLNIINMQNDSNITETTTRHRELRDMLDSIVVKISPEYNEEVTNSQNYENKMFLRCLLPNIKI